MTAPNSQSEDAEGISRTFKAAGKVLFGSGFSKLCLIAVEFLLARYLGPADYGLFSIAFATLLVASSLSQFGLEYAVVQFLGTYAESSDESAKKAVAKASLYFVVLVSVAIGGLLMATSTELAGRVFNQPDLARLLFLVGLIVPFEAVNQNQSAVFRGLRKFRYHVISQDMVRNSVFLIAIPLAILGYLSLEMVFEVLAVASASGTVVSLFLSRRQLAGPADGIGWGVCRRLLSFSRWLFLWQIVQKSANELMVLIAGLVLLPKDVGILALAARLVNLLNFPQSAVNSTAPVELARLEYHQKYADMRKLVQMLVVPLFFIAVEFTIVVAFNSEFILKVFGNGYEGFGWVVVVLLVAKAIDVGFGPVGQVLIATKQQKIVFGIGVVDVLLQMSFVVPLMMYFGLAGAAVGNALRSIVVVAARHAILFYTKSVHVFSVELLRLIVVALCLIPTGFIVGGMGESPVHTFFISMASVILFLTFAATFLSGSLGLEIGRRFRRKRKAS